VTCTARRHGPDPHNGEGVPYGIRTVLRLVRSAATAHPVHDLKWFLLASFLVLACVVVGAGALDDDFALHPRQWAYTLGGGLVSVLVTALAATAIGRRVAEVRASEARFRNLLEAAPDAIIITNRAGRITLVNSQTERLLGYTRAELDDRSLDELLCRRRARRTRIPG